MELATLRHYLQSQPGATEEIPFGPEALVFKVAGRMFALLAWESAPLRLTLKCDPDHARVLRDLYPAVQPGYYMNKRHWNTITLDGSLSDEELRQLSDESYALVVKGLTRAARQQLEAGAAP